MCPSERISGISQQSEVITRTVGVITHRSSVFIRIHHSANVIKMAVVVGLSEGGLTKPGVPFLVHLLFELKQKEGESGESGGATRR